MTHVLRQLPATTDPNLLVGMDHFDDAAVYRIDGNTALVMSVDFFPPLVEDPYTFGQIAATNSLSDIYAMGGRPLSALNIVGFPDNDLPADILADILRGGAERVTAAGAVVAGGHSVRDAEIKYGLAVTGLIHPDRILTNGGAQVGDRLVLTKPLGTGILTSAAKAGKISQEDLAEAIEVMIELNAGACEAMLEVGVHAVTDITGFGLIGHAYEMAQAGGVTIEIEAGAVPLLEHTAELARKKMLTRAYQSNLEHIGSRLCATGVDESLVNILADAQTSGGLLIAVPETRVERLIRALSTRATRAEAVVGRVVSRSDEALRLT